VTRHDNILSDRSHGVYFGSDAAARTVDGRTPASAASRRHAGLDAVNAMHMHSRRPTGLVVGDVVYNAAAAAGAVVGLAIQDGASSASICARPSVRYSQTCTPSVKPGCVALAAAAGDKRLHGCSRRRQGRLQIVVDVVT